MLLISVIKKEVKRFLWLSQQTDDEREKAFYLGAAVALNQISGAGTPDQRRVEAIYEYDIRRTDKEEKLLWITKGNGDPFPISEEDWVKRHPNKPYWGLIDEKRDLDYWKNIDQK